MTGCKKTSKSVYEDCKKAVNIANDYLDFKITKSDAKKRFSRINCDAKDNNQKDILVCSKIGLLDVELSSIVNNDDEIEDTVKELKKNCGL